jgi:hypothetical protein
VHGRSGRLKAAEFQTEDCLRRIQAEAHVRARKTPPRGATRCGVSTFAAQGRVAKNKEGEGSAPPNVGVLFFAQMCRGYLPDTRLKVGKNHGSGSHGASAFSPWTAAFVSQLRELGWIEGRTIAIEYRWSEGRTERYAEIAAELVRLKVDVIVT